MTFNEIRIKELPGRFAHAWTSVMKDHDRDIMRIKLSSNVELVMGRDGDAPSWVVYDVGGNNIIPHLGSEVHFPDDKMSITLTENSEIIIRDYFDDPIPPEQ